MGFSAECWAEGWAERWRIRPTATPRPWRHCATCGVTRAFVCSGRFRTNAQKKSIDVWLNYWCSWCDALWKYPLLERPPVSALDGALLEAFARHDATTVWRYAFDVARLRLHSVRVETDANVSVERVADESAPHDPRHARIHLEVPFSSDLRLDRLLAGELKSSRSALDRWHEERRLIVEPERRDALRKRIRDGQRVLLERALWDAAREACCVNSS